MRAMRNRVPLLLATLFLTTGWTIRELGTLPGDGFNVAYAINNGGAVAGQATNSAGIVRAVWWNAAGTIQEIPTPAIAGRFSHALDINEKNIVVGRMATATSDWHAFKWQSGTLTDLTAGTTSIAFSINNLNHIAGQWTEAGSPPPSYAVVWGSGAPGVPTWLGGFGGYIDFASKITDANVVVGTVALPGTPRYRHAFLWKSGVMTDLGTLGGNNSFGRGLLAPSTTDTSIYVVGESEITPGSFDTRAFIYHLGTMTNIGTLAPCTTTQGNAINKSKWIVGSCHGGGYSYGWLWKSGVMVDLETLLPPGAAWDLQAASDINDHGQIVGWGWHNGRPRAFVMTP
jgi:probable HAF family extracellular repeat protein